MPITKEVFQFLNELKENNNRLWFSDHKAIFDKRNKEVKIFLDEVRAGLDKTDKIEKHSVYRIYRDIRFSKDKTPYKTHFSGYFKRATAERRGSYFIHIQPGNSYVGGGFYGPNKEDLLRIRTEFSQDDSEIRKIISEKSFQETYGILRGDELKTAPRAFDRENPAIDLIRKKQFYVYKAFTDHEVMSSNFSKEVLHCYKVIRPFFDFMSSVLTTDLNGETIV